MPYIQASTVTAADQPKDMIARSWAHQRSAETTKVQEITGFTFDDLIDLINPMHHIPVVGSVYREATGDTIKPAVQLAGDLLLGAATGSVLLSGAMSIASMTYENQQGATPAMQLAGALFNDDTVQTEELDAGNIYLADQGTIGGEPEETLDLTGLTEFVVEPVQTEAAITQATRRETTSAPNYGGIKLGNTIYTKLSPRAPKHLPVAEEEVAQSTTAKENEKAVDGQSLGKVMHEQAAAQKAGVGLPPELVRDMMIMALDKYKTASMQ